jgi:hypothetical protein
MQRSFPGGVEDYGEFDEVFFHSELWESEVEEISQRLRKLEGSDNLKVDGIRLRRICKVLKELWESVIFIVEEDKFQLIE